MALTAEVVEKSALRYTPAGLAAIDVALKHESQMQHAGTTRRVSFEIRGRAIGAPAEALERAALGAPLAFEGFLGAQRNGRGVVLHIERVGPADASP